MSAPYDTEVHNKYRLSDEDFDINQYWVRLTITGKAQDQVKAEVFYRLSGSWTALAQKSAKVKPTGVLYSRVAHTLFFRMSSRRV
jgi:hypothetical protein